MLNSHYSLGGKGLVELDQVDFIQANTGLGGGLGQGKGGSDS